MLPVIIRPRAEADLRDAITWYEARRDGLGEEFFLAVQGGIRAIQANPQRFMVYYQGFRRVILRRFPYKIFYRVERDQVVVFRVLHMRQDHTQHLGASE